jgi:L-ascorbate metabolism protein UlaG (beta-lactamase superfamily)
MLINCMGAWILTDPMFSRLLGLNLFGVQLGIPRIIPPAIRLDALPKPDLVLLSHAHIDHTDIPTLEHLTRRYPHEIIAITAKNTSDIFDKLLWNNVVELDWEHEVSHNICHNISHNNSSRPSQTSVSIRAVETKHNGARMPWERDRRDGFRKTGRSYNAYHITAESSQGRFKAVFGGDTAYTPAFKELASEGGVDVAMMPIGAYRDCEDVHCTPEQSLQMADEMAARIFLPMHFSTFVQSAEPTTEPLQRLLAAANRFNTHIASTHIGKPISVLPERVEQIAHITQ